MELILEYTFGAVLDSCCKSSVSTNRGGRLGVCGSSTCPANGEVALNLHVQQAMGVGQQLPKRKSGQSMWKFWIMLAIRPPAATFLAGPEQSKLFTCCTQRLQV